MVRVPNAVQRFLTANRIAVAGVSRDARQPANAIFRRLRETGHDVVPVNPRAPSLEGATCYPDVRAVPAPLEAVVLAAHPDVTLEIVRQCAERGVRAVWFHRAIGQGSVSDAAVTAARALGLDTLVGGCPLMYCGRVDPFHRCVGAILRWRGRAPA